MQLSENFSVEELSRTDTGIYNTPGQEPLEKLLYLATYVLEPIRLRWGRLKVNSAFRSKQVNDKIGGAATSQHLLGEACDFVPLDADIEEVFKWTMNMMQYGQCILEEKVILGNLKRWIHISLPRIAKQNMMAMTYDGGIYHNVEVIGKRLSLSFMRSSCDTIFSSCALFSASPSGFFFSFFSFACFLTGSGAPPIIINILNSGTLLGDTIHLRYVLFLHHL